MPRDSFKDAAKLINGGLWWEWDIGHETEDPQQNTLNLERTSVTSGVGFVRQQGAPSPDQRKMHGFATATQIAKFREFYNACAGKATAPRTIFYRDIDGNEYEVLITEFSPQKTPGRFMGHSPFTNYAWQYTITVEIVK